MQPEVLREVAMFVASAALRNPFASMRKTGSADLASYGPDGAHAATFSHSPCRSRPVPRPSPRPKRRIKPRSSAHRPDIQERIAEAPAARVAPAIGHTSGLGIDPGSNAQHIDVMRWVLRMKREANPAEIDAVLAATDGRPIVEVSARDPWWGARPVGERYEVKNVLGRLWMELRQQLRDGDPAARSDAWTGRIRVGCLAGGTGVPRTYREAA